MFGSASLVNAQSSCEQDCQKQAIGICSESATTDEQAACVKSEADACVKRSCAGGLPTESSTTKSQSSQTSTDDFSGIDLDINGVYKIIVGIACWLMRVSVALIVIFLIYSGFKFLISKGDAAKVVDARKNLQSVIIGIVVIVGVYIIIGSIATAIGAGEHYSFFTCSESK